MTRCVVWQRWQTVAAVTQTVDVCFDKCVVCRSLIFRCVFWCFWLGWRTGFSSFFFLRIQLTIEVREYWDAEMEQIRFRSIGLKLFILLLPISSLVHCSVEQTRRHSHFITHRRTYYIPLNHALHRLICICSLELCILCTYHKSSRR